MTDPDTHSLSFFATFPWELGQMCSWLLCCGDSPEADSVGFCFVKPLILILGPQSQQMRFIRGSKGGLAAVDSEIEGPLEWGLAVVSLFWFVLGLSFLG